MNNDASLNEGLATGDVGSKLEKLARELHEGIGAAARRGDTTGVLSLTEKLRRVDTLKKQHDAIRVEAEEFFRPSLRTPDKAGTSSRGKHPDSFDSTSAEPRKARGRRLRDQWVATFGTTLTHVGRTLYRNRHGELIGIACATEKEGPDGPEGRWWLGLPKGEAQSIVLVCQDSSGRVMAVCLPRSFVNDHRHSLSKGSAGTQEQFTVLKRSGHVYLQVPGHGTVDVSEYIDKASCVL